MKEMHGRDKPDEAKIMIAMQMAYQYCFDSTQSHTLL
jgi:hypothetical protein